MRAWITAPLRRPIITGTLLALLLLLCLPLVPLAELHPWQPGEAELLSARVMARVPSPAQAAKVKEQLAEIPGVTGVAWLDDEHSLLIPLEYLPEDASSPWYREDWALYALTVRRTQCADAMEDVRALLGQDGAATGPAAALAEAEQTLPRQGRWLLLALLGIAAAVLLLAGSSWLQVPLGLAALLSVLILCRGTDALLGQSTYWAVLAEGLLAYLLTLSNMLRLIRRVGTADAMADAFLPCVKGFVSSALVALAAVLPLCLTETRLAFALGKGVALSGLVSCVFLPVLLLPSVHHGRHRPFLPQLRGLARFSRWTVFPVLLLLVLVAVLAALAVQKGPLCADEAEDFASFSRYAQETAQIEALFGPEEGAVAAKQSTSSLLCMAASAAVALLLAVLTAKSLRPALPWVCVCAAALIGIAGPYFAGWPLHTAAMQGATVVLLGAGMALLGRETPEDNGGSLAGCAALSSAGLATWLLMAQGAYRALGLALFVGGVVLGISALLVLPVPETSIWRMPRKAGGKEIKL